MFPDLTRLQTVGLFALVAILNLLRKESVFVINAVSEPCHSERGHRFKKAGGQPAESAIAQACINLGLQNLVDIDSMFGQSLATETCELQIA